MFGITDLIVSLWLLPVILYVVLPMGMLGLWSVAGFIRKVLTISGAAGEHGKQSVDFRGTYAARA